MVQTVQLGPGGHPAKIRSDHEPMQLNVRVSPDLKRRMVASAIRNNRRLRAEVVAALEAAYATS